MKYLVSGIMSSKEVVKKKFKKKKKKQRYLGSLSVPVVYCFASPMASSSVRLMGELVCSKVKWLGTFFLGISAHHLPPPLVSFFFYCLWPFLTPSIPSTLQSVPAAPDSYAHGRIQDRQCQPTVGEKGRSPLHGHMP